MGRYQRTGGDRGGGLGFRVHGVGFSVQGREGRRRCHRVPGFKRFFCGLIEGWEEGFSFMTLGEKAALLEGLDSCM